MRMSSALLPRAFARVGRERKFTVLDLGSPTPQSVRFFNQFSCQVYFSGLLDDDEDLGTGLDIPSDVRFDVCLFWDVLNYLNGETLERVSEVVTKRLNDGCRGHAFLAFSQSVPFEGLSFGIESVDSLVVKRDPNVVPHVHTWKDLEATLWPFTNAAATLLQGNRQELLLVNHSQ